MVSNICSQGPTTPRGPCLISVDILDVISFYCDPYPLLCLSQEVSVIFSRVWQFGFETFPFLWYRYWKFLVSKKVSVSFSKFFGFDKSIGIGFGKNLVSKKVSDSVSKKIGIGKKFRIRFRSDFGFRHTLLSGAPCQLFKCPEDNFRQMSKPSNCNGTKKKLPLLNSKYISLCWISKISKLEEEKSVEHVAREKS